jgi:predicted acyltransferase
MLSSGALMAQPSAALPDLAPGKGRLLSLDAFRGLTIALMVLVNTAGGLPEAYGPLLHAEWDGWTITDCVFPSFLWMVGVSLTLSRKCALMPVLRRGLILYLLGLLLYMTPNFDLGTARLLGVLQRIAICYVAASLIYMYTGVRGQIAWIVGLLASYWVLMTFVPVPGFGAGRLDEAGNFAHYVDSIVLGNHNYAHTKTWDPEGIVSTLPSIATALFGVLAAQVLRLRRVLSERTTWMYLIGLCLIAAGLMFDTAMPINKKLWSVSFALLMAGLDFVVFGSMLWVVDGLGRSGWVRPVAILGQNAIAIYLAAEFGEIFLAMSGARDWLYTNVYASVLDPKNASLAFALSYVLLMFGIAWIMHRRGWFVRV